MPAVSAQGDVRLRGGFGTPCDPVHSGFIEVFNAGEWGAICEGGGYRTTDRLVADVVCRQLGFPHGTVVDALSIQPVQPYDYYFSGELLEEAQEPQARFWLDGVQCRGLEQRLLDCDLGEGFINAADGGVAACLDSPVASRVHVACRQFAVPEALEAVVTPGAGACACDAILHVPGLPAFLPSCLSRTAAAHSRGSCLARLRSTVDTMC